jgi:ribonuclease G
LFKAERREVDIQVCIHPSVLDRIRTEDGDLIRELQDNYKGRLSFKADPMRQAESFSIIDVKSSQILFSTGDQKQI